MSAGKRFETEVLNGLKVHWSDGLHFRIPDKMSVDRDGRMKRLAGALSPADLFSMNPHGAWLVECKAVKNTSIPFDRLAIHQSDALSRMSSVSGGYGWVAVLFYKTKPHKAFLIPIDYWEKMRVFHSRKSMSKVLFERELGEYELVRGKLDGKRVWLPPKTIGDYDG